MDQMFVEEDVLAKHPELASMSEGEDACSLTSGSCLGFVSAFRVLPTYYSPLPYSLCIPSPIYSRSIASVDKLHFTEKKHKVVVDMGCFCQRKREFGS